MSEEQCIIFVNCIPGIDDMRLTVPIDTPVQDVKKQVRDRLPQSIVSKASILSSGGVNINGYETVKDLYYGLTSKHESDFTKFLTLKINVCLCGGKGGFGQMLKVKAHSMNKKKRRDLKSNSKDFYKTLDGRRVKTIRRIKQLDEYMNTLDEKEKAKVAEKKAKLQKILDVDLTKNIKYEDTEFLEDIEKQLEEIRESVNLNESDLDLDTSDSDDSDEFSDEDSDDDDEKKAQSSSSSVSLKIRRSKLASFFDEDGDEDEKAEESKSKGKENDV